MPWRRERIPRDVKPAVAGKELVGIFTSLEVVDEALELGGILKSPCALVFFIKSPFHK